MDDIYDFCAAILKGFAQPNRLKIIAALRDGELSQTEIETKISEKQSNTSRHLTALSMAGILSSRRDGPFIFFRIRYPEVLDIIDLTQKIVAHEINAYHHLPLFRQIKKPSV
ncbi:Transcriptional regulator, ArsR family [Citrifermentans bremense]|uniref:Transcriptional regulator, ArsR family n=1 Tax=Citrifermentans bremense TaxID=60035 RepID=A0A6S6M113_9BACT|nr:metalloregulator ArsR/SmtB family transcription factor [Citrifermentans bremense]BCG47239.1 Transcriptional regulator, ArsR family [Citrifermentans bremense]